jgi:hypothetical protein
MPVFMCSVTKVFFFGNLDPKMSRYLNTADEKNFYIAPEECSWQKKGYGQCAVPYSGKKMESYMSLHKRNPIL